MQRRRHCLRNEAWESMNMTLPFENTTKVQPLACENRSGRFWAGNASALVWGRSWFCVVRTGGQGV
jgi:hypothetical protein